MHCCSWAVCDDLVKDAEFSSAVFAVGGHYPNTAIDPQCAALDAQSQKPLWASEDFSSYFQAGGCWTRLLNRNYALANITATIAWNLIAAYYNALPYGGDGMMSAPEPSAIKPHSHTLLLAASRHKKGMLSTTTADPLFVLCCV